MLITVKKFAQDFGFSEIDTFSAIKLYSEIKKTKEEWVKELNNKFNFIVTENGNFKSTKKNK